MNNKLRKQHKRIQWITVGVLTFLISILIIFLISLNNSKNNQKIVAKPTIALVNEDQSSLFNKQSYNFGKNYVNLVSGDEKYNWQVVSRSVADRAYADNSVDAVIYISQNFSKDILTLQDISPTQTQVNYKLQPNQDKLSQRVMDDKITGVLYDFNKSIVKMYYASVAGNVSEAQNNMSNVISNQDGVLTALSSQVYGPFQDTDKNYASVISLAESLGAMNTSWIDSQNNFSKSTADLLNSTSKTFGEQLPTLQSYFDTQKEISDTNLKNGNSGIINQATSDQEVYFKQFDTLYTNSKNNLLSFYSDDGTTTSGGLKNLQDQVENYNMTVSEVKNELDTNINSLVENRNKLLVLESELYQQYFNTENIVVDSDNFNDIDSPLNSVQNESNARKSLAKKLSNSFDKKNNFSSYSSQLKELLSDVPWNSSDYDSLFKAMEKEGFDTSKYRNALELISKYGNSVSAESNHVAFPDSPDLSKTSQTFDQEIKITVPKGKTYHLTPVPGAGVSVLYKSSQVDSAQAVATPSGERVELNNQDHIVTLPDGTTEKVDNDSDATFTIEYIISLEQGTSSTVTFAWEAGSTTYTLFADNDISEYLGGANFGVITDTLNKLDKLSTLIAWVYGEPGADVSSVLNSLNTKKFENISDDSIYNRYGNMNTSDIEENINKSDVDSYLAEGNKNISEVISSITNLNSNIASLNESKNTLGNNLPVDVFEQNIQELQEWYQNTLVSIDNQYNSWKKNEASTLELKSWQEYKGDDIALYQDNSSSEALYKTISELSSSTAKNAEETAKSAMLIKDNADQFKLMINTTHTTKTSAEKLLNNTNNLLKTGNDSLKESDKYNKNFSKVLSNTRNQNSNKSNIYNFFAQPLNINNITGAIKSISKDFDGRWIVILVIGILVGIMGTIFVRLLEIKKNKE